MKAKILIVDDQPDNLDVIVRFIEEDDSPYELLQALNAKTALKIIHNEMPDLIITDWEMPEMDGIELIKEIKANELTWDIPIIMCTGVMVNSADLKTALDAGAVDYIRKPIDKVELLARIQSVLRLAESYKEIKKLNKSKNRIFSIIAHDLSAPVGNMKSFLEWIVVHGETYDKQKILDLLQTINKQSSTIYHTLRTLLNWAQCQTKALEFNPQQTNIIELIHKNEELLKYSADKKGITFKNKFEDNLVGDFDSDMISTVFRNLLSNAIKFSHLNSSIVIKCYNENEYLVVCIRDKGLGIAKKNLESIFDKTNYTSTFGTQSEKGSGLGLKICKEFIDYHKGEITVKSNVNKGSKFCFSIPKNQN